jgi:Ca-activated chloride channel family protein
MGAGMKSARKRALRPYILVLLATALGLAGAIYERGWKNMWLTPDQRGRFLMDHARPAEAAATFHDPAWRGVASFRAGDFKAAAQAFAGLGSAEGAYDEGNALVMLGKYDDAAKSYDRALALRPGWPEAEANRNLAGIRAERLKTKGGEESDGEETPDEIVYDKGKKNGPNTTVAGEIPEMSDPAIRALWLKRVQTRPADFLKARFAYQLQSQATSIREGGKGSPP